MKRSLKAWQHNLVRDKVLEYRRGLENYYIKDKPVIEMPDGTKAFSLLSPSIGSAVGRRRVRYIIDDLITQGKSGAAPNMIPASGRTPHLITVAVTYDCQCACGHCSAATYQEKTRRNSDLLTFEELKKSFNDFIKLGATSIILTGGEPLLHPRIFDLVKCINPNKAICTIYTNGEYLDKKAVVALKSAGAYGVFVSLDFADSGRHDANRQRPGLFEKAVSGIKRCQDAGLLTGISTYVTKEKIRAGDMDALMELGRALKVLEVCVFDIIATGRLDNASGCSLTDPDFELVNSFRGKYNISPDHPRIIHQTMLTSIAFPCTGEGCPAGIAQMHLRANGDISPCDFTPTSFGDVRTDAIADIWKKMTTSPWYARPSSRCRLSDLNFLKAIKREGA